jgi:hypothetical protein
MQSETSDERRREEERWRRMRSKRESEREESRGQESFRDYVIHTHTQIEIVFFYFISKTD